MTPSTSPLPEAVRQAIREVIDQFLVGQGLSAMRPYVRHIENEIHYVLAESWPVAGSAGANDDLLREAHTALDILYAELITSKEGFYPSRHSTWPTMVKLADLLKTIPAQTAAQEGTPEILRTNAVAAKIGFHAAAWKKGEIGDSEFDRLCNRDLEELRGIERRSLANLIAYDMCIKAGDATNDNLRSALTQKESELVEATARGDRLLAANETIDGLQASIADFVNTEARQCGAVESPNYQAQNIKDCVARIVDKLRRDKLAAQQALEQTKAGVDRFYIAYGPHLPECWRAHLEGITGKIRNFGALDAGRIKSPSLPTTEQGAQKK